MSTTIGSFTDYNGLVELLRARKDQLQLSNEALDELCGLTAGFTDKLIGPSQLRGLGPLTFGILLDALGLSGTLYVDEAKVARFKQRWERERRAEIYVRKNRPVSQAMVRRALRQHLVAAARKRWGRATPEAKAAAVAAMNAARTEKRLRARTSNPAPDADFLPAA